MLQGPLPSWAAREQRGDAYWQLVLEEEVPEQVLGTRKWTQAGAASKGLAAERGLEAPTAVFTQSSVRKVGRPKKKPSRRSLGWW